ncbi:hypothetical protein SAICODRAFT_70397 [Saitoella complicata NRRL Y-17804]|uniref:Uncharacterized protein n=1 Tax=Saitoella complicata (strain BCRC 22490 / CBS 7301 / JCM 7358 / NBRC 10748 / NRRL Y-17804) TaxID=698492 RepID=A0A0E9NS96_SAICN|nr:uncharacterized protein SAICODRAFT_70397 [Saitoella complicata NRRL Y-17804]ODQ54167.1 hypothetical protein SAICODRAFT_70397 [Saitoella complicata NRRL Y-17804]GAO52315.1 hypothetical protein G7K_6394-t1 [Saitoella complicata NRRL Y-17804]
MRALSPKKISSNVLPSVQESPSKRPCPFPHLGFSPIKCQRSRSTPSVPLFASNDENATAYSPRLSPTKAIQASPRRVISPTRRPRLDTRSSSPTKLSQTITRNDLLSNTSRKALNPVRLPRPSADAFTIFEDFGHVDTSSTVDMFPATDLESEMENIDPDASKTPKQVYVDSFTRPEVRSPLSSLAWTIVDPKPIITVRQTTPTPSFSSRTPCLPAFITPSRPRINAPRSDALDNELVSREEVSWPLSAPRQRKTWSRIGENKEFDIFSDENDYEADDSFVVTAWDAEKENEGMELKRFGSF